MSASHQLWARAVWGVADLGLEAGMSPATLFEGLPFDGETLRKQKRVRWDDYCVMVERIAAHAGGPDELEDLLESTYHQMFPELRRLAGIVISPKTFVRFVVETVDPLFFPFVDHRLEDLGDDRVRITMWLLPGVRACEAWFRGTVGSLRGLTRHLDLPSTEILSADVGPDHLIIEARLPASRTFASRARQATGHAFQWLTARFVLGTEPDGSATAMAIGEPEPDPVVLRASRATVVWKLSPRQAEVLPLVVAGLTNKEIAQRLATAENTIELHVTALLRKASVASRTQLVARFWAQGE